MKTPTNKKEEKKKRICCIKCHCTEKCTLKGSDNCCHDARCECHFKETISKKKLLCPQHNLQNIHCPECIPQIIVKDPISRSELLKHLKHHPRKGLGEQYTMGWNNAKDYVKRKICK